MYIHYCYIWSVLKLLVVWHEFQVWHGVVLPDRLLSSFRYRGRRLKKWMDTHNCFQKKERQPFPLTWTVPQRDRQVSGLGLERPQ